MIVVASQAWSRPSEEHAQAYIALSGEFARFFEAHPGYRGRRLVRSTEDPWHFTHLRYFDTLADYEECTAAPGYVAHTEAMYAHLQPYDASRGYPREVLEVVLDDPDPRGGR
ncbi:antibiotic biosynthesis monooxygenase [Nocardioides sp.]|uniref:antibiotic biosynthesis monooxygenase family protein n=1 Tax=Nocardioides sp. TaxID=35761 RepID=UPI002606A538|nr:antibiotic biosynthesis monooxygenase [Nocardioides sp.]